MRKVVWNEKNNVINVAEETNRLVIGKRVAAELMVLCLAVMSLGENPLQIQSRKNADVRFTEHVRTTENLKKFDTMANEMDPDAVAGAGSVKGIAGEDTRKIAGETVEIGMLTETEAAVSLTETAIEEAPGLENLQKMTAEMPSVVWNPVNDVPNADEKDAIKEISSDRLNDNVKKTEQINPVLPTNKIEIAVDEAAGKDEKKQENQIETITPVTPSEVPGTDDSTKIDAITKDPTEEKQIEELKPEDDSEPAGENTAEMNSGFLIDESGKITGISNRDLVVSDGCLILPSEGCTGITAGAFLGAGDGIVEVSLPANMTDLEEGAFLGLNEVEWIETEENPVYFSEDGVLFSEDGTCLFAFPAGRTGTYPLPESVTRIATDAFAGASIEKISDLRDREIDFGNIPEHIILE